MKAYAHYISGFGIVRRFTDEQLADFQEAAERERQRRERLAAIRAMPEQQLRQLEDLYAAVRPTRSKRG